MDLKDVQIGPETNLKLELVDGKLKITVNYAGQQGGATLSAYVSPAVLIDELEKAIPGQIDDLVLEALKKALS